MKTIVVYYSLEGNTDFAAGKIAGLLGADTLRLHPKKEYPTGPIKKFFWGGKSAVMGETPELEPYTFDASAYERVIIGTPVWAGTITPPVRTFIKENDLSGKKIAAFVCQAASNDQKTFMRLKDALKIETLEAEMILVEPKKKPKEMNEERIAEFCAKLGGKE